MLLFLKCLYQKAYIIGFKAELRTPEKLDILTTDKPSCNVFYLV